jgi:hypothetical protein
MSPLEHAQAYTAEQMTRIKAQFKPGVKITVAVRTPDLPERDFLMTDDEPAEVIAMLERRILAAGQQPPSALPGIRGTATDLEVDGRGCSLAMLFHFLDEASSFDDARCVALLHGWRLTIVSEELADEQVESSDATTIITGWTPEPPFEGAIFAGKGDTEDGELCAYWLRRLEPAERQRWADIFGFLHSSKGLQAIALQLRRGAQLGQTHPSLDILMAAKLVAQIDSNAREAVATNAAAGGGQ